VTSYRLAVRSQRIDANPQYLEEIATGEIDPRAQPNVSITTAARVDVDGRRCFGPVAGSCAAEQSVAVASREGVSLVTVRQGGMLGESGTTSSRSLVAVLSASRFAADRVRGIELRRSVASRGV
jgi:LDH2 family malate/lactate/ureidoglycolate dehydrogenase